MISVSQAVQSLLSPTQASSVQLSRTALLAASQPLSSSVRLSDGAVAQEIELYTPAGLLSSVASVTDAAANDSLPAPAAVDQTASAAVAPVAPTSSGPPPVVPAQSAEPSPALTPVTANVQATDVFADPAAKALADFTANPVHGNLATALFINAANFRARQASAAVLVNAVELPGPVSSLNAINVDVADLNEQDSARRGFPRLPVGRVSEE